MISIICALAKNRAIGFDNKLLYHLKDDLITFKNLTINNVIIMGRKTFESLPKGALPNRRNIVLTRNKNWKAPNVETFSSLNDAILACSKNDHIFIIGGESLYKEAMKIADKMYLTHINDIPEQADAFFPEFNHNQWDEIINVHHIKNENNEKDYDFIIYDRKINKTLISNILKKLASKGWSELIEKKWEYQVTQDIISEFPNIDEYTLNYILNTIIYTQE